MAINLAALALVHPDQAGTLRGRCITRAEVWRDPDTTLEAPHANSDEFGFPVASNAPLGAPAGKRLLESYDCEYKTEGEGSNGTSVTLLNQEVVHAPWRVAFLKIDNPDVRSGDELHLDGRVFSVIAFGQTSASSPWLLARCQETSQ